MSAAAAAPQAAVRLYRLCNVLVVVAEQAAQTITEWKLETRDICVCVWVRTERGICRYIAKNLEGVFIQKKRKKDKLDSRTSTRLVDPFPIKEPQHPSIDNFYVVRKRRSTDFEAGILRKVRSGGHSTSGWVKKQIAEESFPSSDIEFWCPHPMSAEWASFRSKHNNCVFCFRGQCVTGCLLTTFILRLLKCTARLRPWKVDSSLVSLFRERGVRLLIDLCHFQVARSLSIHSLLGTLKRKERERQKIRKCQEERTREISAKQSPTHKSFGIKLCNLNGRNQLNLIKVF